MVPLLRILTGLFALLISFSTFSVFAADKTEQMIHLLQTTKVVETQSMQAFLNSNNRKVDFDNEVFLITLQNGTRAVFKPVPSDDLGDAHAEVVAYKASQFLGFPNVPPTVIRKINGKMGSLQLYVEPSIDSPSKEAYSEFLEKVSPIDLANLKLFYFVMGQWDSGAHNIIIQKKNLDPLNTSENFILYAIDNSGIRNRQYVRYGSLPFVRVCYSEKLKTNDWHLPFPYEKEKIIENPTLEKLHHTFGETLPDAVLNTIIKRYRESQLPFHYVLYKNSLYVKFHAEDPFFVLSHTKVYPPETIEKLKQLNIQTLNTIFADAKGADFLTPEFLNSIIERRNQIIADYEKT